MCVILLAHRTHPRYRLVVAANRDEFHARPTAPASWWDDAPDILAGRDLQARGTWMGVTRDGHFAAITNYREATEPNPKAPSRGALVGGFLRSALDPLEYIDVIKVVAGEYLGFSLLLGNEEEIVFFSNRAAVPISLAPGVYGLSNRLLDSRWPKVERGKTRLATELEKKAEDIDIENLFDILSDRSAADEADLPDTGVGLDHERFLSPLFIVGPEYGTRSSTVLIITNDGAIELHERSFDREGTAVETRSFQWVRE